MYSRLDTVIDLNDDFGVGLSTLYRKALLNLVVFLGYYLQLSHADPQV